MKKQKQKCRLQIQRELHSLTWLGFGLGWIISPNLGCSFGGSGKAIIKEQILQSKFCGKHAVACKYVKCLFLFYLIISF